MAARKRGCAWIRQTRVAENLEPYIKRDLKTEDYVSALTSAKLDNKIYGIPHGINPGALAFNKQIFKENNIPFPTDDWTYNDMIETAKKLTKDTNGDGKPDIYGFQAGSNITLGWLPWMRAYGGSALDSTLTKSNFTDSKSIQGLTAWADTINKLKVSPTREAATTGKFFENGKVAMTFSSTQPKSLSIKINRTLIGIPSKCRSAWMANALFRWL